MTRTALVLLSMGEEHIPAVAKLGQACFSLPWTEDGYRLELGKKGSLCLTALAEDRVAGYLCASSVLDEAELCLLAVDPALRRRGIAAALLSHLLTLCPQRGITLVHLEVRASNMAARTLYERFGFLQDGLRRGYYRHPPEDAVLYSLRLMAEGETGEKGCKDRNAVSGNENSL